jgi:hypothetical protein
MAVKIISDADAHALACFFGLHHASLVLNNPGVRDIERVVMATFGLAEKKGPYRLTRRGNRAIKLAQSKLPAAGW